MKRLISLCLLALLALSPLASLAETPPPFSPDDYVTLSELREQALVGWHETYAAHGREVVANVDIHWMPEGDACPILEIEGLGKSDVSQDALAKYQGGKGMNIYSFPCSLTVENLVESSLAPGAKGSYGGKLVNTQPYTEWKNGDVPTFQPDNVDLSYGQFLQKIDAEVKPLFGLTLADFRIRRVTASGVEYMAKENKKGELITGKQFSRWGSFFLEGEQLFHGIPVVGYSGEWTVTPKGSLEFHYENSAYYHFTVSCSRETGVRDADAPLLSFDAMKRVLEAQIEAGQLRAVDEMEFGYLAMYEGKRSENRWLLVPVWRMLGGYTTDPAREHVLPYTDKNGEFMVPQEYYDYFYNAQTGEMLPTDALLQNGSPDNPIQVDTVLTWGDVGGNR